MINFEHKTLAHPKSQLTDPIVYPKMDQSDAGVSDGGVSLAPNLHKPQINQQFLEGRIHCRLKDTRELVHECAINVSSYKALDSQIQSKMVEVVRTYGLKKTYRLGFEYQDEEQKCSVPIEGSPSLGDGFAKAL